MKFKNSFKLLLLSFCCQLIFITSCKEDDNVSDEIINNFAPGACIVNQGLHGTVDGTLNVLSYDRNTIYSSLFLSKNGRSLGDTPQWAVAYGSKIYIAVYGSNTIEVVDRHSFKLVSQIIPGSGQGEGPRCAVAAKGKIYVSMYDGYVSRIDTTSMEIDGTVAVGPNPEEMASSEGFLYVANSDGMNYKNKYSNGKSVSKIDLNTFSEVKKIGVGINPVKVRSDNNGNIYVISMGDYNTVKACVYKIDPSDNVSSFAEATLMACCNNILYTINSQWGSLDNKYVSFDCSTGDTINSVMVDSTVLHPCALAVDPESEKIFISSYYDVSGYSDYSSAGYLNIYSSDGKFEESSKVGITPAFIFFY